jgi:hypothetical protein
MATYNELHALTNDHVMKNKVSVAAMIKANAISDLASPTTAQLEWVKQVYENPTEAAGKLWPAMLGANSGIAVAAITGATDAAIQTAVDTAVDNIYTKAGV